MVYGTGVVILLAGATAVMRWRPPAQPHQPVAVHATAERPPSPSLRCLFSDFTHASVVVGFEFEVTLPTGAPPRFVELAEAVRSDPAVNFDANSRPTWSYSIDEDGTQTIASPDGATRILLYGLKLGASDAMWIEAGIRSNTFRNLDGKCLQSHFDELRRKGIVSSAHP